jgi:hypothetical protein
MIFLVMQETQGTAPLLWIFTFNYGINIGIRLVWRCAIYIRKILDNRGVTRLLHNRLFLLQCLSLHSGADRF